MRSTVALLGLLALAPLSVATAQAAPASASSTKQFDDIITSEVNKAKARLKLTPDQVTKLRAHLEEGAGKLDALDAEYLKKEDAIVADYRARMRKELTPEQQVEWDKIKDEWRERVEARIDARQKAAAGKK